MISRQDYLDKQATHRAYYGQFVTPSIKETVQRQIGMRPLLASLDPHFNDIALDRWAALPATPDMQDGVEASGSFLAESEVVCIYKEAARQLRAEHALPRRHMISVHFRETDETLATEINGTVESICDYYMQDGGRLNLGRGGDDRIVTVVRITFHD